MDPTGAPPHEAVDAAVAALAGRLAAGSPLEESIEETTAGLERSLDAPIAVELLGRRFGHAQPLAPMDRIPVLLEGVEVGAIVGVERRVPRIPVLADLLSAVARQATTAVSPLVSVARELNRSRERLASVVDTAPVGIVFYDRDGVVTLANHAAHDLLGVEVGQLRSGGLATPGGSLVAEVLRTGAAVAERHLRLRRGDGRPLAVVASASPVGGASGQLAGVVQTLVDVTAIDDAREEAEAEKARLGAVMRQVPGFIWVVDRNLRLVSHTGTCVDARKPAVGDHLSSAFGVASDSDAIRGHIGALQGEAATYEHWLGERRFKVRVEPSRDGAGAVDGAIGVSVDVTDLRRAEEAARHLAAIVESAEHAVYSVDLHGRVQTWNAGAERLYGWSSAEMVGVPVDRLRDGLGDLGEPDTQGVARGERFTFQTVRRRKDGTRADVMLAVSPIYGEHGRVVAAGVIAHDVSEQVTAQRQLAVSERRFRELAEHSHDAVFRVRIDPEPALDYISPAIERITGFAAHRFSDAGWMASRLHPDDRAAEPGLTGAAVEGGAAVFRFRRADGAWVWLQQQRLPVIEDKRLVAIHGILRDVSERQETERALRVALEREEQAVRELGELDELKTSFLQAVSHELRTPLTTVVGLAATLDGHRHRLHPEQQADLLRRLRRNAERLERLLADLLDIERLSRKDVEAHRQPIDLTALVREVTVQVPSGEHYIDVRGEPVSVPAEPQLIERVVDNLVRNAVRHTPPGSKIAVSVAPLDDGAVLRVDDDGPGVPPELRPRVFDPFVQGVPARNSHSPGTGIGLSLVARFARLHGGRAWVGTSPLGGASFRVWLPGADRPEHYSHRTAD